MHVAKGFFFLFFSLSFEVLLNYLIYNHSRTAKIIRFLPKLQCRERCYNPSCHNAIGGANPTQSLNPNPSCGAAWAVSTQPALCCEVMASCWLWHSSLYPVQLREMQGMVLGCEQVRCCLAAQAPHRQCLKSAEISGEKKQCLLFGSKSHW